MPAGPEFRPSGRRLFAWTNTAPPRGLDLVAVACRTECEASTPKRTPREPGTAIRHELLPACLTPNQNEDEDQDEGLCGAASDSPKVRALLVAVCKCAHARCVEGADKVLEQCLEQIGASAPLEAILEDDVDDNSLSAASGTEALEDGDCGLLTETGTECQTEREAVAEGQRHKLCAMAAGSQVSPPSATMQRFDCAECMSSNLFQAQHPGDEFIICP